MKANKPLIILALVILIFSGALILKNLLLGQKKVVISPNTLYLTQPILDLAGTIDKITDDAIQVSGKYGDHTVRYTALLTKDTVIVKPVMFIPYLLKDVKTTPMIPLTLSDLFVGETIKVQTNSDLRTLSSDSFQARGIQVLSDSSHISGIVTDVNTNSGAIEVSAVIVPYYQPGGVQLPRFEDMKKEIYMVKVTNETEISRLIPPNSSQNVSDRATPQKLSVADLKKDMIVDIYINSNAEKTKDVTALLIQPLLLPQPPGSTSATALPTVRL